MVSLNQMADRPPRPVTDGETVQLGTMRIRHLDTPHAKPLTQSPIADEPYGSVLVFRDPDNIQLELFAPPAH